MRYVLDKGCASISIRDAAWKDKKKKRPLTLSKWGRFS